MPQNEKPRKEYKCDLCEKVYDNYQTYYSHKKLKHLEPRIKCFHCEAKFKTIHDRDHHYYTLCRSNQKEDVPVRPAAQSMSNLSYVDVKASKPEVLNQLSKPEIMNQFEKTLQKSSLMSHSEPMFNSESKLLAKPAWLS